MTSLMFLIFFIIDSARIIKIFLQISAEWNDSFGTNNYEVVGGRERENEEKKKKKRLVLTDWILIRVLYLCENI